MTWELIKYSKNSGKFNMDFDIELAKQSVIDKAILRFYGWSPYCISIGANQPIENINTSLASKNNIDVVIRPTGGRAILHADELTYSVVLPNSHSLSGKQAYEEISTAIIYGLKDFHPALSNLMLENQQPSFPELLKNSEGAICFGSTAKNEIKFKGRKLVGSAQKKMGSTLLQHGSILLGPYHKNLVNYLNVTSQEKETFRNNIYSKTISISEIIDASVDILKLQESIILGFQKIFSANFLQSELTSSVSY